MAYSEPQGRIETFDPPLEPAASAIGGHRRSFATSRVILALLLREMTSKYGRSPGGYLWAIIEPLGMILMLSVGFSLLMRAPSLGSSFLLFYASGYMVFQQYKVVVSSVENGINYSRALLNYPAVTWLDALIARFVLNALTNILNTILILGGVLYFVKSTGVLDLYPMLIAMALASLLGLSIGSLNCLLSGLFPVWKTVTKIINRPLMIASAVLYIFEDMPMQVGNVLWWNPLTHLTGLMRQGMYSTYHPQYISITYVVLFALVPLAVSLLFLRAYNRTIINQDFG
ncbi:ABC transporter permease [Sinisalibacter lacisalsi]|nr:ABC transporter permease [Sinisalibacter lacisalsi]